MTIRSGGRPRDSRATRRPPYDPDAYATESDPRVLRAVHAAGAAAAVGGGGQRVVGLPEVPDLRARPCRARAGVAAHRAPAGRQRRDPRRRRGQPSRAPVAVRQGHRPREPRRRPDVAGLEPSRPRSSSSSSRATRPRRSPTKLEDAGLHRRQPGVRLHRDRPRADRRSLQQGTFILRKNMTPGPAGQRAARAAGGQVRRHRPADRASARADHRQARDARRSTMDAAAFYDLVEVAAGRAHRRLSVAQEDPGRRPEGRLARGLPVARRPTASCPTRRPRSWSA